ncbi:MAG: PGPGW domain-containing protein [Mycobacteriales bacterium]
MTPWHLRDRVRRLPAGELVVRVSVFLLGAAFIALGAVLVVLPGPLTIPPMLLGVFIWSLEFEFARALLERVQVHAQAAWDAARAKPWRTALVTGTGLVLAVGAVVLALRWGVLDQAREVLS